LSQKVEELVRNGTWQFGSLSLRRVRHPTRAAKSHILIYAEREKKCVESRWNSDLLAEKGEYEAVTHEIFGKKKLKKLTKDEKIAQSLGFCRKKGALGQWQKCEDVTESAYYPSDHEYLKKIPITPEPTYEGIDGICCPISLQVMRDPVVAPSGRSYEREHIERYICENRQNHGAAPGKLFCPCFDSRKGKNGLNCLFADPITKTPVRMEDLIPNRALQDVIRCLPNRDGVIQPAAEASRRD